MLKLTSISSAVASAIFCAAFESPSHHGCSALGIIPEDVACGIDNAVPSDFNPRPSTDQTVVTPLAAHRNVKRRF